MFELLEKLREKPEKVKKRFAFIIALSIAGIIFVVWLSVIFPDWKNNQEQTQSSEPSPLSTFSQTFSSGISSISEQFGKIKNVMSVFSNTPAYYSASSTNQNSTSTKY